MKSMAVPNLPLVHPALTGEGAKTKIAKQSKIVIFDKLLIILFIQRGLTHAKGLTHTAKFQEGLTHAAKRSVLFVCHNNKLYFIPFVSPLFNAKCVIF
ncbi:MAG: hypothetical protein DRO40_09715 [Thermoprotei archaeon]|nr:MAG: hypothetical protein DRO40_09715 [Thermoprotei archaeon]